MSGENKDVKDSPSVGRELIALLAKIAVILLLAVLVFTFVFGLMRVEDHTMLPSTQEGDLVVYYRLDKDFHAGDCVVVEHEGKKQVRRVAAMAGDIVDIRENGFYVNGYLQSEPMNGETTLAYEEGVTFPITLKEGELFVLGDVRNNTADSRLYGAVNEKQTLGKMIMLIRRREF